MVMARFDRNEAPGALHHVVAQAASDSRIVVDDSDRLRLLDGLRTVVGECGWQCLAYCVMGTHAHLVLCTPEPNLGQGMQLLLGRYAFAHNRRHRRRGHLFGDRFWSRRIDRPHHLLCASLYSVLNPVSAGLCAHPAAYGWSSYSETAGVSAGSGILEPALLLRTLGEKEVVARERYRELVDDAVVRLRRRRQDEAWWRAVERSARATRAPG
jgi:REP element-mobilizing transposase RayT